MIYRNENRLKVVHVVYITFALFIGSMDGCKKVVKSTGTTTKVLRKPRMH